MSSARRRLYCLTLAWPVRICCPGNQNAPKSKAILPCFASSFSAAGSCGTKNADDADAASSFSGGNEVVHGQMIGVVTVAVAALVAHAFATTISTFTLGQIENLIYRFRFH